MVVVLLVGHSYKSIYQCESRIVCCLASHSDKPSRISWSIFGMLWEHDTLDRPKAAWCSWNSLAQHTIYFKKSWKALSRTARLGSKQYETHIDKWTCNCGHQKVRPPITYVKHLVQAVPKPNSMFWSQLFDGEHYPSTDIPELIANGWWYLLQILQMARVSDGDDHIWLGDKSVLRGGGVGMTLLTLADQPIWEREEQHPRINIHRWSWWSWSNRSYHFIAYWLRKRWWKRSKYSFMCHIYDWWDSPKYPRKMILLRSCASGLMLSSMLPRSFAHKRIIQSGAKFGWTL